MTLSDIPYMRWAKHHALDGEFNLTQSAVPPLDWEELGFDPSALELFHYSRYGDVDMLDDIADRWGWSGDRVFLASSVTHVHFCVAASILEPGNIVLYESPGYLPLVDSLSCLGVDPRSYRRVREDRYALPREELRQGVAAGAQLILVTHLHNPSGVALSAGDQSFLVDLCESTGVTVLADEMYRPFLDPDPGPMHALHPNILSVMGLNKVHGLPQIRVGWAFASPERIDRARCILDATTVHNSCLTDQVARYAVRHMDRLEQRGRGFAQRGWDVVGPWLDASPLQTPVPDGGLVCFPRVPTDRFASSDRFAEAALAEGVNLPPGRFFGDDQAFRLGFASDPELLRAALERLDRLW